MNVYFFNLWNRLRASLWLLPALMIMGAFILSLITLNFDRRAEIQTTSTIYSIWEGGADGARQLLATIAGSMITITGVVFSITTVSLALTSTQFGSKLLRNFMQDLGTQIALGTFISTSIYALLILKTIRHNPLPFIPNLSITISLGLAILSLCLLIYFIHHLATRVQSVDVIARIAHDLNRMIEKSMQNRQDSQIEFNQPSHKEKPCTEAIFSSKMGYLQAINYQHLIHMAKKYHFIMELNIRPGHFLRKGMILAKINSSKLNEKLKKSLAQAFIIGKERSPTQDIEYSIDQLVAIGLRALGMNANDPFTTNTCLDHLGAMLCLMCQKEILPPYYEQNPYVKLTSKQVTFKGLVDASFHQIRQYGSSNPSVLIHLLETLSSILPCTQTHDQREALKKHALMIKDAEKQVLEERDRLDIKKRFDQFNSELKTFSSKRVSSNL